MKKTVCAFIALVSLLCLIGYMAVDASSYLCVVERNLVDIDGANIESVTAVPHTDVLTSLKEMLANMRY